MTYTHLLALLGFAFVSSATPGPNNLMLLASGANFGLRRTLPHMLGISLGHGFMVFCVGAGLAGIFTALPQLHLAMKIAALGYMLWLAWKIANAAPLTARQESGKPFTFLQAAGFQWVNPKALAMALTATTVYGDGTFIGAIYVALAFICVNFPAVSIWAILGTQVARVLHDPAHMRLFNWTMAGLLVATLFWVI